MKKIYFLFLFYLVYSNIYAQQATDLKEDSLDVYILKLIDTSKLERYPNVAYSWGIDHDTLQIVETLRTGEQVILRNYDKTQLKYQPTGWGDRAFIGVTLAEAVYGILTLDRFVVVEGAELASEVLYLFQWPDSSYDCDYDKLNQYIKAHLGLELIKARQPAKNVVNAVKWWK